MSKSILVPTDFSNDAYNALFYATQLYKNQKCTFHMLHAYGHGSHFKDEFRGSGTTQNLLQFLSNKTADHLRETYHRIMGDTEKNPLHKYVPVPKNDSLENAVNTYVSQNAINLIVMGTKGRTKALDIFFGSNAVQMIKSLVDCPLLLIPKQIDYTPISQMGYITSFKHSLGKQALRMIKSLLASNEASLQIVHISEADTMKASQEKNKQYLHEYFADTCIRFHTIPKEKSVANTVIQFAKKHTIDLLTMCYHPHHFLETLFHEPVAMELGHYSEIPLLILPIQE